MNGHGNGSDGAIDRDRDCVDLCRIWWDAMREVLKRRVYE